MTLNFHSFIHSYIRVTLTSLHSVTEIYGNQLLPTGTSRRRCALHEVSRVDFAYKETTVLILKIAVVFVVIWFFVTALMQRIQLFYVYIFFVLDVRDLRAVNCVVVHTVMLYIQLCNQLSFVKTSLYHGSSFTR